MSVCLVTVTKANPVRRCYVRLGSAHHRHLANHVAGIRTCLMKSARHGTALLRCHQMYEQTACCSSYRPKDVYRARMTNQKQWTNRISSRFLKIGSSVLLTVSLVSGYLVYRTLNDLEKLTFFPHVFHLERGADLYIATDNADEENEEEEHEVITWIKKKFILFPWLQSHSNDLWTLLNLAQSEERSVRHLGVQSIAEQKHWSDAEYRTLAQALDYRTMVGLARTKNADHRLFLPPPRIPPQQDDLEDQLRSLLSSLPSEDLDKCTKYFTSSALREGSIAAAEERGGLWCFGGNGLAFAESLSPVPPEVVELFCLQALVKHTREGPNMWRIEGDDFFRVQVDTSESQREGLFLQALQGYSQLASHCPLIVKSGGIHLMRQIHDLKQNSVKISRQMARVLSNLALYKELHNEIISAGWVTILSKWLRSGDFALTLHATKALANLDRDYGEKRLYPDGVYLYYPQYRYREPVYADVIFVHGLLGGPFRTWRQSDLMRPKKPPKGGAVEVPTPPSVDGAAMMETTDADCKESSDTQPYTLCWPKDWLSRDFPHIRILTVEYETHLSEWAPRCPYESEKRTLMTRSQELLHKLRLAGVGDRPIIWVGHSMGGLLIKQMLLTAKSLPSMRHIVDRSRGIVMYSVPHRGSPLAAYSNHTKFLLYPSVEVKELHQGSQHLQKLHEDFTNLMFDVGIPLLSFTEGQKTDLPLNVKVMIVPPESSDPGFGEVHVMKDHNHLNICKPLDKASAVYQLTLDFIRACVPSDMVGHILKANIPEEYIFPEDLGEIHREGD